MFIVDGVLAMFAVVTVSLMVIIWMILSSVGITIARYMKPLLTDFVVLRNQLWFQVKSSFMYRC